MSKRAYFILVHIMVTAEEVVQLFLHHTWKLHRLPVRTTLDRRPEVIPES